MNPITEKDIQFYNDNGYLMLGQVMTEAQRISLKEIIPHLERRPTDRGTLFFTQLRGKFPAIMDFSREGAHLEAVKKFISPNLRCWFDQYVIKLPDHVEKVGGTFPWHQDNGYGKILPDNNVTVWFALEDVTEDNGCVWVAPGSHKKGLVPHIKKSEESWYIEVDVEGNGVPATLKAGEAVLFSGYTLHRSLTNRTDKPRLGFFLEYCDADAVDAGSNNIPINQHPPDSFLAGGLSPVLCGTSQFNP